MKGLKKLKEVQWPFFSSSINDRDLGDREPPQITISEAFILNERCLEAVKPWGELLEMQTHATALQNT